MFAWGSADCEEIEWSDCPEVLRIYQTGGWPDVYDWIAARRGIEPQEPMKKAMTEKRAKRTLERLGSSGSGKNRPFRLGDFLSFFKRRTK